jgi:hypothetical protein
MKTKAILTVGALVLCAQNAQAATPILSGTYNFTNHAYCQPTLGADFNDVTIDSILYTFVDALDNETSDPGNAFFQEIFAATITPGKHTPNAGKFVFSGYKDEASIFLVKSTGKRSGTQGEPLAESPTSGSGPYSNTATTFTAGDATYKVFYGQIDGSGIAHSMTYIGLSAGNSGTTCSNQGEATRQ